MRVVTRALSMASTVSGNPGPVPGAGANCAKVTGSKNLMSAPKIKSTIASLEKNCFTQPPR
jgi:hypothetical protein